MTQATILAAAATAATSTDVTVAAGAVVTVGLFVAAGQVEDAMEASLMIDTPGTDVLYAKLSGANPVTVLSGPCTARVFRPASARSFGVFTET